MGFIRDDHEILRKLEWLEHHVKHIEHLLETKAVFTAVISQEDNPMAIGNINAGSTGTFVATLLQNGVPDTTDVVTWTYDCSDPTVTIAPSADTKSAVYSVPSNDTGTSFQAGASAVAPDGTTVTTPPLTVTLTPGTTTVVFSASITQTA